MVLHSPFGAALDSAGGLKPCYGPRASLLFHTLQFHRKDQLRLNIKGELCQCCSES